MLLGISGKKQSGKNFVADMIRYYAMKTIINRGMVFTSGGLAPKVFMRWPEEIKLENSANIHIKPFAEPLKQIVCIMLGCTMEQLEDNEFKETELGPEWWLYKTPNGLIPYDSKFETKLMELIKLTPRKMLQLIGTDGGRNIVHPNVWVNARFSTYTRSVNRGIDNDMKFPHWIIPDVRFPNEVIAIRERQGLVIRVEGAHLNPTDEHESETALDDYHGFNHTIYNDNRKPLSYLTDQVEELIYGHKLFTDLTL